MKKRIKEAFSMALVIFTSLYTMGMTSTLYMNSDISTLGMLSLFFTAVIALRTRF